uniref:Secreted protein n=1 Tax=Plectus sambesii TaxID=2011161 RepID=A0A914W8F4_9BILA
MARFFALHRLSSGGAQQQGPPMLSCTANFGVFGRGPSHDCLLSRNRPETIVCGGRTNGSFRQISGDRPRWICAQLVARRVEVADAQSPPIMATRHPVAATGRNGL